MIFSSLLVVFAKNPVHSVLALIWTFLNAAILFLFNGAEFLALIFVIVYVGAVAVLFLFIVMMLDVTLTELRRKARQYVVVGSVVGASFAIEMVGIMFYWRSSLKAKDLVANPPLQALTNTEGLGNLLYTHYFFPFQLSALILLIAMVGAIVLTFSPSKKRRRPSKKTQLDRTGSVTLSPSTEFHKGVKIL